MAYDGDVVDLTSDVEESEPPQLSPLRAGPREDSLSPLPFIPKLENREANRGAANNDAAGGRDIDEDLAALNRDIEAATREFCGGHITDSGDDAGLGLPAARKKRRVSDESGAAAGTELPLPDDDVPGEGGAKKPKRKKRTAEEIAADKAEKEADKAQKQLARAEEKARKDQERKDKALQRQQEREAKKEQGAAQRAEAKVAKEMQRKENGRFAEQEIVVAIDCYLMQDPLGLQACNLLREANLEYAIQALPLSPLKYIAWRRRTALPSQLASQAAEGWSGVGEEEDFPYLLVCFKPEEFVAEAERDGLLGLLQRCGEAHPRCTLGLLCCGLEHHLSRREAADHDANMRAPGTVPRPFSRAKTDRVLEDLLVGHPGVRVRLALDMAEGAEHVVLLTKALANQKYKAKDAFLTAFSNAHDTAACKNLLIEAPLPHANRTALFYAVSQIPRVVPAAAHAITTAYASLGTLIAEYMDRGRGEAEKDALLKFLPHPKDPTKKTGPAASKKLYRLLTATDPFQSVEELCD